MIPKEQGSKGQPMLSLRGTALQELHKVGQSWVLVTGALTTPDTTSNETEPGDRAREEMETDIAVALWEQGWMAPGWGTWDF